MTIRVGSLAKAAMAATLLVLAACNPMAQIKDGDSQVEKFHSAYARGDRDALYAMTGRTFRTTTSRSQFDDLIDVVSVRLGAITSSERIGFNVNSNADGTFTSITMTTHFAKGDGQENFVFSGSGDAMRLEGWHVQAPQLELTADDIADERAKGVPSPVVVRAAPTKGARQN